ncbi:MULTISPECIES: hypothetical protein [Methylorubrum]|jgi:hypothetical protein|uniref:Uncharacterized protein n=1 Tax=Methylorubrum suomiense TaxID=144191 RepID=A0ABQ4V0F9_9HYPH|nr:MULTISPECIES: hypothetical protein [Methylobacteriaceae]GJE77560.1 hypothetical protein BGCPKDLD_4165 [Methylorubrum suomiense]
MVALFSLVCLVGGAALAATAERYPEWTARIETAGGLALVTGLATIGAGLKVSV